MFLAEIIVATSEKILSWYEWDKGIFIAEKGAFQFTFRVEEFDRGGPSSVNLILEVKKNRKEFLLKEKINTPQENRLLFDNLWSKIEKNIKERKEEEVLDELKRK